MFCGCSLLILLFTRAFANDLAPLSPLSPDSKHFLIHQLNKVNPSLEWDNSNFLMNLSTMYANCQYVDRHGAVSTKLMTKEGSSIVALLDNTRGRLTDWISVQMYVRAVVHRWITRSTYNEEIRSAEQIGCSTRAGCEDGVLIMSCMMSSGLSTGNNFDEQNLLPGSSRAFTPEQYESIESAYGRVWDRSYFLENLAGQEANCSMLSDKLDRWESTVKKKIAKVWGIKVRAQFGFVINEGHTQDSINKILNNFKQMPPSLERVGCSLISDCRHSGLDHVLIVCFYK